MNLKETNPKPLSKREKKVLSELEGVIAENLKGFVLVGTALMEIRDQKLYRIQADTFEEYMKSVWDLCESRGYQFMDGAQVIENLHNCGGFESQDTPENEGQARPLTLISPEEQVSVWQLVLKTASEEECRITAALVTRCVREYKGEIFRKALDSHKKDASKKPGRENGKKISPKMDESFRGMLSTIEGEMDSNWRNTSKDAVRNWLQSLLTAVEEL